MYAVPAPESGDALDELVGHGLLALEVGAHGGLHLAHELERFLELRGGRCGRGSVAAAVAHHRRDGGVREGQLRHVVRALDVSQVAIVAVAVVALKRLVHEIAGMPCLRRMMSHSKQNAQRKS
jgi:hypothetical protein